MLQFSGSPVAFVQQIQVKSVVTPWPAKSMIQTDAFRGPLSTVFGIVEKINNFKIRNGY